jgi:hypothetical protein
VYAVAPARRNNGAARADRRYKPSSRERACPAPASATRTDLEGRAPDRFISPRLAADGAERARLPIRIPLGARSTRISAFTYLLPLGLSKAVMRTAVA